MDFSEYQTEIIEDIKSCLEGLQVQPILFMGAGVSQRYLKAPDWENLLKYLAETCPLITRPYGYYSQTRNDNKPLIASDFSESYAEWAWDVGTSRYPEQYFNGKSSKDIYIKHEIATLLNNLSDSVDFSAMEYTEEIEKLKKVRPHAIITTNYDDLLEKIFDNYQPIVGHNVVTVNYTTYGEIMKIHGSSKEPESIIITNEDYVEFYKRKKYISAKLLTYFVEHPLFFIGYSINDENIKAILSDIDEIISPNNALIPNIYLVSFSPECEGTGSHQKEILIGLRKPRKIAMATPIILNGARVNLIPRCVYQGSIIRTAIEKRKFSSKRENILDNTEPCQTKIRRSQCCCGRTIMVIFKHGTFALLNVITITFSRCLPTNFL